MLNAVLLLSSGLDSAANLVLGSDFTVCLTLTVDYGQKGAVKELGHASQLATHYGVEHTVFDLRGFSRLVGAKSALMGGQAIPSPESLDDLMITTRSAASVWVPNRNGVLLSIAAALAESRGLDAVAVGFNAEEAVTFPDNTLGYMKAMSGALAYSTANQVQVVSATAEFTKKQIVKRLADRGFAFELLWSCYESGVSHCGRCESCLRLGRALRTGLAGKERESALEAVFGRGAGS